MRQIDGYGGARLAVYDGGDPALPAAVVAHGAGSSARFVRDAFAGPFEAVGYRLVAYDLRGHGKSSPARDVGDHDRSTHAADLGAVVAEVDAGLVGGVSLGAHAAATWLARGERDIEGALLCLPAMTGRSGPGKGPHAAVAEEVRSVGIAGTLERLATDTGIAPWLADLLLRDWRLHDEESLVAALVSLDGGEGPGRAELAHVQVPTGVVGWPDDSGHPLETAAAWAEALPVAALEVTDLAAVGDDPSVLGAAALRALRAARVTDREGAT